MSDFTHRAMQDYHNTGLFNKTANTFFTTLGEQAWKDHLFYFGWNPQSYPITLLALMWKWEQRVQRPTLWLPIYAPPTPSPLRALCGSRVSTFNRLGASVYGAFIMATEQSGLSGRQFGWAVEINQNSSGPPQIAHHTLTHPSRLVGGDKDENKRNLSRESNCSYRRCTS